MLHISTYSSHPRFSLNYFSLPRTPPSESLLSLVTQKQSFPFSARLAAGVAKFSLQMVISHNLISILHPKFWVQEFLLDTLLVPMLLWSEGLHMAYSLVYALVSYQVPGWCDLRQYHPFTPVREIGVSNPK
jgi:hypothetical protein